MVKYINTEDYQIKWEKRVTGHLHALSVLPLSLQTPSHYHKHKKTSDSHLSETAACSIPRCKIPYHRLFF